ncbi:coniferyl-alcohol dehydrogenase [Pseudomonas sp. 18175]|uniref:coniferyl-alcohol dehydrogenase n=1 Tax=Pseudomonas sp. 18175 TaxID=3390056 RepID=UPI003D20D5F7
MNNTTSHQGRLKSLRAAGIGNALEWFDWTLYATFSVYLASNLFDKTDARSAMLATLAVFAGGFVARPIGGWLFGRLSDRLGRRTIMVLTMLMLAISSLGIALIPDYQSIGLYASAALLFFRLMQGLAHGGETGVSYTYVAEIAPSKHRGLWSSSVYVGVTLGVMAATAVAATLTWLLGAQAMGDYGWRIGFALGGVLGIYALFLRRGALFKLCAGESCMLNNKTLVITGVSSGIGEETARIAREQGAQVIGVDINPPKVEVDQFIQADLSSQESIDALLAQLPRGIDGLANIAGLPPTQNAERVIKVNLVGLKYLTLNLLPKLADNASIVNLASLAGAGWPDAVASIKAVESLSFADTAAFCEQHEIIGPRSYFFSKEALIAWTLQNRWTWRERGIRVNAVSPGLVDTPILKDFIETLGARAEEDMKTMDRPGRATDIAPVVAFLLSDGSRWMRGTNLAVDGGMHSHILASAHGL